MIVQENEEEKNIPDTIQNYIEEKVNEASDMAKEAVADSVSREIAITIVKAGTWISLFIIARILFIFLKLITSLIAKLPVIKQFDNLGGIIYGLLEGIIIVYIILAIVSFVSPMINPDVSSTINNSTIGGFLYNNNLLLKIIF